MTCPPFHCNPQLKQPLEIRFEQPLKYAIQCQMQEMCTRDVREKQLWQHLVYSIESASSPSWAMSLRDVCTHFPSQSMLLLSCLVEIPQATLPSHPGWLPWEAPGTGLSKDVFINPNPIMAWEVALQQTGASHSRRHKQVAFNAMPYGYSLPQRHCLHFNHDRWPKNVALLTLPTPACRLTRPCCMGL